jgi:hypothetical protein
LEPTGSSLTRFSQAPRQTLNPAAAACIARRRPSPQSHAQTPPGMVSGDTLRFCKERIPEDDTTFGDAFRMSGKGEPHAVQYFQ